MRVHVCLTDSIRNTICTRNFNSFPERVHLASHLMFLKWKDICFATRGSPHMYDWCWYLQEVWMEQNSKKIKKAIRIKFTVAIPGCIYTCRSLSLAFHACFPMATVYWVGDWTVNISRNVEICSYKQKCLPRGTMEFKGYMFCWTMVPFVRNQFFIKYSNSRITWI